MKLFADRDFFHRLGICIRPLQPENEETVKRYWPYTHFAADSDSIIGDGIEAGLSAGAFVTEPASPTSGDLGDLGNQEEPLPADGLASWMVANHNGCLGFLHTLSSQRRQGVASMVLAELTRILEAAGYPPVLHTDIPSVQHIALQLGYEPIGSVFWAIITPTAAGAR